VSYRRVAAQLTASLLTAGGIASTGALASPQEGTAKESAVSTLSPPADEGDHLAINNPGSIVEQLREDAETKEYLFQTPGIDEVLQPWYDFKTRLDEEFGLRFGFSATHMYQWASDTVGPEDDGSGFELVLDGTWTLLGRDGDSPTMAGFEFLYRDRGLTDMPPAALFKQIESLYPTTVAFADVSPSLGQLWIQQKFGNSFGFQVGKLFPVSAYDFFPLKNFRTDFVDGVHGANVIIPLPDRGLGGFVMYRPQPNVYLRLGVHDANADAETSGFNSLFDVWHQDARDDANVDDGWGFVVSGSQRFGRLLPFFRYGYSDSGRGGPTPMAHMVNGGIAFDDVFGQDHDRIGVGLTWARPADGRLDDQGTLDVFYRVQFSRQLAVTPIVQLIIDPVRNPDEDAVVVLGLRTRLAF